MIGFARTLRVTTRGLDEKARALLAAAGPAMVVRDHVVPGTGRSSPLTGLGHGRGVGDLGGVARIVRRLMVPPRIAATLGH